MPNKSFAPMAPFAPPAGPVSPPVKQPAPRDNTMPIGPGSPIRFNSLSPMAPGSVTVQGECCGDGGGGGIPGPPGPMGPPGPPVVDAVRIVGNVATQSDLNSISNPQTGDAYVVNDTNSLWVWDGSIWLNLGPASGVGSQTPWLSNIDGAGYSLSNLYNLGFNVANVYDYSIGTSRGNLYLRSDVVYAGYPIALTAFNGRVSIGTTAGANFPLDVSGDVNSSACYRINGAPFACPDGSGGVNLSNITTINGSAPGAGGGGGGPTHLLDLSFGPGLDRYWNNNYQNTRGTALYVSIIYEVPPAGEITVYGDYATNPGGGSPSNTLAFVSNALSAIQVGQLFFIVRPGDWYSVHNAAKGELVSIWKEWY